MAASEGEAGAIDDLIKLTHLHEPAILHTIELRYWRCVGATGACFVCVAVWKKNKAIDGTCKSPSTDSDLHS